MTGAILSAMRKRFAPIGSSLLPPVRDMARGEVMGDVEHVSNRVMDGDEAPQESL